MDKEMINIFQSNIFIYYHVHTFNVFQLNQNYQYLDLLYRMNDFQRIFQSKLPKTDIKIPVACSILEIYQKQKELLESAKCRREAIEQKNKRIAQQNLKYRQQLDQKLTLLQQKHDKNRRDVLTKVVKSQERRKEYRQQIFSKHKDSEKQLVRQKIASFRQNAQQMHDFWVDNKIKTERNFKSQSAVKPLYWESVQRKKSLQRQQHQKGMMVKSQLLKRHEGREELVHKVYQEKQQQIHKVHKEQIEKTLLKNKQILDNKIKSLINNIGDDFRRSNEVLHTKQKFLEKKIKDKQIDQEDHRLTVRSNFFERFKQRASSLSACECKRINNIEPNYINSAIMKEQARHIHFGDTLRKFQREPSQLIKRTNQFLTKSVSFRSTVSYNKSLNNDQKHKADTHRLIRQKQITESLLLKKSLQIQGNCYIRKTLVK